METKGGGDIVKKTPNGLRLSVRVQPRSSRSGILGIGEDALRVAVHAPPDKGAANRELVKVLSDAIGVPKSALSIVAGEKSRNKEFLISAEIEPEELIARLSSL